MVNRMKKIIERTYPFLIPIPIIAVLMRAGVNFIGSVNLNGALEAIITVSSLIIGFLGAVLPVIMSMKNDSKIVQYVFERDKDKLFLKYIKETLLTGILVISVAVIVYFRDQYQNTIWYKNAIFPLTYILMAFLLCTYRCLDNMLNLIFASDKSLRAEDKFKEKSDREKNFEEIVAQKERLIVK